MRNKQYFIAVFLLSWSLAVTGNVIGGKNTGIYSEPLTANYANTALTANLALTANIALDSQKLNSQ
ncbi:MAG: hypothetical protein AABZ14_04820 [Candidatus Margulisiibacteriota bacterium]